MDQSISVPNAGRPSPNHNPPPPNTQAPPTAPNPLPADPPTIEDLLAQANAVGATFLIDSHQLKIDAPLAAETLARVLIARKTEVFAALASARQLLNELRKAGHELLLKDGQGLHAIPPLTPDHRAQVRTRRATLIALLRSQAPTSQPPLGATTLTTPTVKPEQAVARPTTPTGKPNRVATAPSAPTAQSAPLSVPPVPASQTSVAGQQPLSLPIDWKTEYRLEREGLRHMLRNAKDDETRKQLYFLLHRRPPMNELEWLTLGQEWLNILHGLRRSGAVVDSDEPLVL